MKRHSLLTLLVAILTMVSPSLKAQQLGCTDPAAVNFDPSATEDDGSCYYYYYGCTDPNAVNYDPIANMEDGSCYYYSYGCTDPNATNYDPNANMDDGSCNYIYYGCTDPSAVNYNPSANADDGSCYFQIYGCTNPLADNYDPNASIDDGSCSFSGTFGCTDPNAANYNSWANYDDGSCYYNVYGCTDPGALNFDPNANTEDGTCYYGVVDCNGDLNGTAMIDDCGNCTGGNTGLVACVLIGVNSAMDAHQALKIYPNPNNGSFSVSALTNLGTSVSVQLLDVTGRVVHQQNWSASKRAVLVLDMQFEDGMYLLNVAGEHGKRWSNSVVISQN